MLESTMVQVTLFLTYRSGVQRQSLSFILRDKNISMLFSELCSIGIGRQVDSLGEGINNITLELLEDNSCLMPLASPVVLGR